MSLLLPPHFDKPPAIIRPARDILKPRKGLIFPPMVGVGLATGGGGSLALDGHNAVVNANAGTGSKTISLTTTQSNDVICVFIHAELNGTTAPTVASVSASGCTTFQKRSNKASIDSVQGNANNTELWWAVAASPLSAVTITVSWTGSPNIDDSSLVAFGVSGANTSSPFDPNISLPASASNDTSSSTPTVSGISTTNANTMLIGGVGSGASGASTEAVGSGYTLIGNTGTSGGANASTLGAQYKLVTSAQSGVSQSFGAALNNWAMLVDAITA